MCSLDCSGICQLSSGQCLGKIWGMMHLRDYFQLLVWISSGECVVVWVQAVLCHLRLRPQDRLWLVVLPAPDVVVGSTMSDSSAGKWVTLMFLCCAPSGLQDSCASLRSSWLLLGQLVLSCLLNFAFTHIQEYLKSMGDSLRHRRSVQHVQSDNICKHAHWQGCNLLRELHQCKDRHLRNCRHQIAHADITHVLWVSGFWTSSILSQLGSCNGQWFVIGNF